MQVLLTGLPGNGKTLFMISEVDRISKKDNRPVFYNGINGLTLPWIELTDDQILRWWEHLPPNAIICLDEGQRFFRPEPGSRTPPEHIRALETHRHLGIDFWLTTQDPSFVHGHWRKLAGRHLHFHRKFGLKWSTIYEWAEVQENPKFGRQNAIEKQWTYPQEYFGVYKSAEAHTQKVAIPKKLLIAGALLVLLPLGFIYAINRWYDKTFLEVTKKEEPKKVDPPKSQTLIQSNPPVSGRSSIDSKPVDARESYINARVPVLEGLPHTAPIYSALVQPRRVPAPFACVQSKDRCQCYTDSGTRLPQVSALQCAQIVEHGFYADWLNPPIATLARGGDSLPASPGARAPE